MRFVLPQNYLFCSINLQYPSIFCFRVVCHLDDQGDTYLKLSHQCHQLTKDHTRTPKRQVPADWLGTLPTQVSLIEIALLIALSINSYWPWYPIMHSPICYSRFQSKATSPVGECGIIYKVEAAAVYESLPGTEINNQAAQRVEQNKGESRLE